MRDRQWAPRATAVADPAEFAAAFAQVLTESAGRAAGLAAAAVEGARAGSDIAAVAAQLMSQREVMAAWLVDGMLPRTGLRAGVSRADAIDTVRASMDPVIFCTPDCHPSASAARPVSCLRK